MSHLSPRSTSPARRRRRGLAAAAVALTAAVTMSACEVTPDQSAAPGEAAVTAAAASKVWANFDKDLQGWTSTWGKEAFSTERMYSGAGSMKITSTRTSTALTSSQISSPAVNEAISGYGTTLSAFVKLETAPAGSKTARIGVADRTGKWAYGPSVQLTAGTWVKVSWTPSKAVLDSKSKVGLALDTQNLTGDISWFVDNYIQEGAVAATTTTAKPATTTTAKPATTTTAKPATTTTVKPTTTVPVSSARRFPGDPNTKVTGKSYWGAAVGANTDPASKHETPTGKSLSARRTYHQWSNISSGSIVSMARSDIAKNRLPVMSIKPPTVNGAITWKGVADGQYDADIRKLATELGALNGPVWLILHHEPENDVNSSTRSSAAYRGMQTRFNDVINASGAKNIAVVTHLMEWTFQKSSGRNPADWYVPGVHDVALISNYCMLDCYLDGKTVLTMQGWKDAEGWVRARNIPYGTGEWQVKEQGDASKTPSGTTGSQTLNGRWAATFTDNRDFVAHLYFDTDLARPNPDDPYLGYLRDSNLTTFQNITRSDPRVQRINDLK